MSPVVSFHRRTAMLVLALGFYCGDAQADGQPGFVVESVISNHALSGAHGVIAVNLTAGDANKQANATAVVFDFRSAGLAAARVGLFQHADRDRATTPAVAVVRIAHHSFAYSKGLISINQASGQSNAQANTVAIALAKHGQVVAESLLSQAAAPSAETVAGKSKKGLRRITVDETAFRGARGLVQLNQAAGLGNITANSFALRANMDVIR